jgi:tetratricopeptide (TPR) repeat protein
MEHLNNFKKALQDFAKNQLERNELAQSLEQVLKQAPEHSAALLGILDDYYGDQGVKPEFQLHPDVYSALKSQIETFVEKNNPPSQAEEIIKPVIPKTPTDEVSENRKYSLVISGGVLLLAIAAGLVLWQTEKPPEDTPEAAEPGTTAIKPVTNLLRECKTYFDAGHFISNENGEHTALSCYRDVLKLDSKNDEALAALRVIELHYMNLAEEALRDKQLDKAKSYISSLETVNPSSDALPDLKKRFEQAQGTVRLADLLQKCQKYFDAQHFTTNEKGGTERTALVCYREVLELDPNNVEASNGLKAIEERYKEWAYRALSQGQLGKVERYITRIEKVNPQSFSLADLRQRLAEQKRREEQGKKANLLQKCEKHFKHSLTTGKGAAQDCYQEVLKQDAGDTDVLACLEEMDRRYRPFVVAAQDRGLERVPPPPILADLEQCLE